MQNRCMSGLDSVLNSEDRSLLEKMKAYLIQVSLEGERPALPHPVTGEGIKEFFKKLDDVLDVGECLKFLILFVPITNPSNKKNEATKEIWATREKAEKIIASADEKLKKLPGCEGFLGHPPVGWDEKTRRTNMIVTFKDGKPSIGGADPPMGRPHNRDNYRILTTVDILLDAKGGAVKKTGAYELVARGYELFADNLPTNEFTRGVTQKAIGNRYRFASLADDDEKKMLKKRDELSKKEAETQFQKMANEGFKRVLRELYPQDILESLSSLISREKIETEKKGAATSYRQ